MIVKFVAYLIAYAVYPFSYLIIRKRMRYAFGSFKGSFNDNAKYLFIYASEHCLDREVAWLSDNGETVAYVRSLGFKAYKVTTFRGAWYALTSKYWFFNAYTSDIMFCLSGGAVCCNLWHGVGIKRIEYNITSGELARRYQKKDLLDVFFHPQVFRKPDYVLSSTPFQTIFFSTSFRVKPSACLELGYPRNEILLCSDDARMMFVKKYSNRTVIDLMERMKTAQRVYIYMPTWRDSQLTLFTQGMDLDRLNDVLRKHGDLLLLKPHANVQIDGSADVGWSNIVMIEGGVDVYPLLPYTDVLITDYSSILYDYILMPGKGVLLYLYDYADYVAMRDFFFPYDENVVGSRVYDFDSLVDAVDNHKDGVDEDERLRLVEKFWGETARYNSGQKIMEFFKDKS